MGAPRNEKPLLSVLTVSRFSCTVSNPPLSPSLVVVVVVVVVSLTPLSVLLLPAIIMLFIKLNDEPGVAIVDDGTSTSTASSS